MEPFEINLVGENLTVTPIENGSYVITKAGREVTVLVPEITDGALTIWKSKDMSIDQAMQIGELIEEHYL
ncbi:hypothetical protein [Daejeonella lutea]|nr:hypothetical protein [Daejeonella lutea]